MKIAVVGLGAAGVQVLWNLSNVSGVEAHGFDSAYPGHPFGASGGESRLFRNFEIDDLEYSPVIRRADELWRELEQRSGQTLRDVSGALLLGDGRGEQMLRAQEAAGDSDLPHEILDRDEMARRFPGVRTREHDLGIWDAGGGTMFPELTIATTARLAAQNGALIHDYSSVERVTPTEHGIVVRVADEDLRFDRVVVAAGGWTTKLFPFLDDRIVTKRLTSAWFLPAEAGYLAQMPPLMRTAPTYCYGLPNQGKSAIKLGLGFNDHLSTGDPDSVQRRLGPEEVQAEMERFGWILREVLPGLDPHPLRMETYIESYSTTMREYVRPHPEDSRIAILTGFSGHGFKVSPAIGEIGAQLITEGDAWFDFGQFDGQRNVFEILDVAHGTTSYNPLLASTLPPESAA